MINWSISKESTVLTYDHGHVNTIIPSKLMSLFNKVSFFRPKLSVLLFRLLVTMIEE